MSVEHTDLVGPKMGNFNVTRAQPDEILKPFDMTERAGIARVIADEFGHNHTSVARWIVTNKTLPDQSVAHRLVIWLRGYVAGCAANK